MQCKVHNAKNKKKTHTTPSPKALSQELGDRCPGRAYQQQNRHREHNNDTKELINQRGTDERTTMSCSVRHVQIVTNIIPTFRTLQTDHKPLPSHTVGPHTHPGIPWYIVVYHTLTMTHTHTVTCILCSLFILLPMLLHFAIAVKRHTKPSVYQCLRTAWWPLCDAIVGMPSWLATCVHTCVGEM